MRTVMKNEKMSGVHNGFNMDDALVVDSTFEECTMEGAFLMGAMFVRCHFKAVDWYWAHMFQAVFLDSSFEEVDFRGANMAECLFMRCALMRCDFSRDNLGRATDLSEVSFVDSTQVECKGS